MYLQPSDFGHIILRNQHLIGADVKYLVLVSFKHQFPSVRVSNITTSYNLSQFDGRPIRNVMKYGHYM